MLVLIILVAIVGVVSFARMFGVRIALPAIKKFDAAVFATLFAVCAVVAQKGTNAPPRGSRCSDGVSPSHNGGDAIATSPAVPRCGGGVSPPLLITPDPGTGPFTNVAPFAVTSLCFTAVQATSTSFWLSVSWPYSFSPVNGLLDVYARGTLSPGDSWRVAAWLPVASGSTNAVFELQKDSLPTNGVVDSCFALVATLYVLGDPVVVFDYDRDGEITDAEAAIARAGSTKFRFWINDDGDTGDINGADDDIPGHGPDHADDHVNGRSDMLDFTPAWIDMTSVFPPGTPLPVCEALNWTVRSDCVNVMWTILSRAQAGMFHRTPLWNRFGIVGVQDILSASVTNTANGAIMPTLIRLFALVSPEEKGVFLVEGRAAGTNLTFEAWADGNPGQTVVSAAANLRISPVEDMYRHLNTRGLSGEAATWEPSTCNPTNRPDAETSDRHLVFLHGANVTQQRARGWCAEVFKRMWQSGMTAKFTGVTWRSDIGSDVNYQENVSNAFFTASVLASQIAALPGTKVLMAHSLGNMVCSSMIQDYGLVPACYLMCNSAVPAEAYDTDELLRVPQLVHPDWTAYPTNSWASRWYWLFRDDPDDDRKFLGWPGRFANVSQYAVNFYSTGDEILELAANNHAHWWTGIGSSWGHLSWHKQELFKGRGGLGGTSWSGWNIEENIFGRNKIQVEQALTMTEEDFKTNTVFYCYPPSMNQPSISLLVRGAHLAQGIPALTPATGRVAFGGEPMEQRSFNCHDQIDRPNGWPERSDYQGQWCHSDLKDVAYFYVFKFYEKVIEKGNLK